MSGCSLPSHRHYCDDSSGACTYLGSYKLNEVTYDMYYHGGSNPAVYVTYGSEGQQEGIPLNNPNIPEYAQGAVREALFQARRQARLQGYFPSSKLIEPCPKCGNGNKLTPQQAAMGTWCPSCRSQFRDINGSW